MGIRVRDFQLHSTVFRVLFAKNHFTLFPLYKYFELCVGLSHKIIIYIKLVTKYEKENGKYEYVCKALYTTREVLHFLSTIYSISICFLND